MLVEDGRRKGETTMKRLLINEPGASEGAAPRRDREPPPGRDQQHRYHELDWLRAFIIFALVPTHAMGFFTATSSQYFGTRYAAPVGLSTLMTIGRWGIALLFLIAGAAAQQMLSRHSSRQFLRERGVRLLIPFLFASVTFIPLQDYLIVHTFPDVLNQISAPAGWDPHFATSPGRFYLWFVGAYAWFLTHYTPQYEFIFWSHLWFIARLICISLVTLPLLLFLRGARGERLIVWLAALCERRRGGVFLLAAPLGLVLAILGWQWQGWQVVGAPDGANMVAEFAFYALVYIYGFVLYSDARLREAVRRDGGVAAVAIAILAFVVAQLPGIGSQALAHDYSIGGVLAAMLRTVAAWLCIVGVVGISMRVLNFTNRFGRYLTDASYPFYVLHLAVLYLIGLPFLANGAPALLSFLVMVVFTYALTLAVYELVARRIGPVQVLFGMRQQATSSPA